MDGDTDLDDVLFGGSDPPADGSFDPFLPGLGEEGREDYGDSRDSDTAIIYSYTDAIGRQHGTDSEGPGRLQPDDDQPLPWSGTAVRRVVGADEQRDRAATDIGIRSVAAKHQGSIGPGGTGREQSDGVANSLFDAQQRIRAESGDGPTTVRIVEGGNRNHTPILKPTRPYERQEIHRPPEFENTSFEAMLLKQASNTAGEWIITLKAPMTEKDNVFDLADAYGLALTVTITRKRFRPDAG